MKNFLHINKPTLLLDRQKCQHNIRSMVAKAKKHGLHFPATF
jgi:D-serine deaminase-like pyridoxal phosphate-dependent protein